MSIFTPDEMTEFASVVERTVTKDRPGGIVEQWRMFAELGWLSIAHDEVEGGLGGGLTELILIQQALGKAIAQSSFLTTIGMAVPLIQRLGTSEQRSRLLGDIAAGGLMIAAGLALSDPVGQLAASGTGERLSGIIELLSPFQPSVRAMMLVRDDVGYGIAIFSLDHPNVQIEPIQLIDGSSAARITAEQVDAFELLRGEDAEALWLQARARGAILACAEAAGAMDGVCAATIEYVAARQQFGKAIGSFQAVQHKIVDMVVAKRRSQALVAAVARMVDAGTGDPRALAAACKVSIGRSGRLVGEQAIQLHGGMGMSSESAAAQYHLRLLRMGDALGGADHHLGELLAGKGGTDLELVI